MSEDIPFTRLPDGRNVVSLSPGYQAAEGDCCLAVRFVGNTPAISAVFAIGAMHLEPEHLYAAAKRLEAQANAMLAAREAARAKILRPAIERPG